MEAIFCQARMYYSEAYAMQRPLEVHMASLSGQSIGDPFDERVVSAVEHRGPAGHGAPATARLNWCSALRPALKSLLSPV
jgi:hypothetical protein